MALSIVGFAQSASWGWNSPATWSCLAAGAVLLGAFVVLELRTAEPLVDVRLFRQRGFRVDSAVLFLAMMAFVPTVYFLSLYANVSLGLGAGGASKLMLTFFLGYLIAAQVGGRVFDRRGAKPTILLGCLVGAAGFLWWATQVTSLDLKGQSLPLMLAGAGIGLLLGPSSSDAVSRAPDASYGAVTGVNQTVRNYGSALGIAVLGTVLLHAFTARFTSSLVGLGVPQGAAAQIADGAGKSGGTTGLPPALQHAVAESFAHGMQLILIGMAGALALAFVVALRHPGDRPAALSRDVGQYRSGGWSLVYQDHSTS